MNKLLVLLIFILTFTQLNAQKIDVTGKVKEKVLERAEQRTDDAIDYGLDKTEEAVIDAATEENEEEVSEDAEEQEQDEATEEEDSKPAKKTAGKTKSTNDEKPAPTLTWAKYDFVPGDQVLFEDNHENEQNGEFPSKWDLAQGVCENANFDNSNIIFFKEANTCVIPFIKNSDKDYLPDIFTLEFDAWFEVDEYCAYYIYFFDKKNQSESSIELDPIEIQSNEISIYALGSGYYPGKSDNDITKAFWRHIAVSFNVRALKVYLDDARILNIPNLGINPEGITICSDAMNTAGAEGKHRFIKNIRLAKGGVKLYDKLLQDGKIVTSGIRFDVNKATIKPESMGVINSIAKLMNEHPEVKFSVEGHTDSDGDDASNQSLSEKRAKAVADKLIEIGIASERLKSKGWGESKPIDNNGTSEGKANNRRVEFIKL